METLFDKVNHAVKNWWLSLLLGILYVAFAIFLMVKPFESYAALSIFFSCFMFVTGIFEISFAITNKSNLSGWGWYLAGGILDLLIGIILVCLPVISMMMIPFIVAFWLMFRGFSAIGFSVDLQHLGSGNWGWYLVFGILAVICSFLIIWRPEAGALTLVFVTAFAFLFMGVFRIMLSIDLKKLKNKTEE